MGRRARRGRAAAARPGPVLLALSGSETVEQAVGAVAARARRARRARGRAARADERRARRLPRAALVDPRRRARRRRRRRAGRRARAGRRPLDQGGRARNGAEVVTVGAAGSVQAAPGTAARRRPRASSASGSRAAERAVLIWSGPGGQRRRDVARLGAGARLAADGCGAFYLPATPNGRAVADAWAAAGDGEPTQPERDRRCCVVSGDEAAADPRRPRARRARRGGDRDRDVRASRSRGWADLVLPGDELPRARRDDGQPRGPAAAPAPHGDPARARTSSPGSRSSPSASASSSTRTPQRRSRARRALYGGLASPTSASRPSCRRAAPPASAEPAEAAATRRRDGPLRLARATGRSSPGRRSSASPELQFQRPGREIELVGRRRDACAASRPATRSSSARTARPSSCARASTGGSSRGIVRVADEHTPRARADVEVTRLSRASRLNEPWWIGADQGGRDRQRRCWSRSRTLTWLERKLLGRMQLRYGPNRAGPFGPAPADRRPDQAGPQGGVRRRSRRSTSLYIAAPAFSAFTALAAFSVIPFGEGWQIWRLPRRTARSRTSRSR